MVTRRIRLPSESTIFSVSRYEFRYYEVKSGIDMQNDVSLALSKKALSLNKNKNKLVDLD